MDRPRIGLALGGGGARGFAHIGVLQILQDAGIPIDYIAGTSMGAVIGAMYAETLDAYEVENRWVAFLESDSYRGTGIPRIVRRNDKETSFWDQISSEIKGRIAINIARSRKALIKTERLTKGLGVLVTIRDFSECKIPLTVVATDMLNGTDVPMRTGELLPALQGSSAVPGFLEPVQSAGHLLSDGGVSCPVPVSYARGDGENTVVIGVGVAASIHEPAQLDNAIDIMNRAEQITSYYYSNTQMKLADVPLYPDVYNIKWNEFERLPEMVQSGRKSAESMLSVIQEVVYRHKPWWQRIKMLFRPA